MGPDVPLSTTDSADTMLVWDRLAVPAQRDYRAPLSGRTSPASFGALYNDSSSSSSTLDTTLPTPSPSPRGPAAPGNGESSKTQAFFASPFSSAGPTTPLRPPPPLAKKAPPALAVDHDASKSPKSATFDFFSTSWSTSRPTPPPSLRSASTVASRDPSPSRLPPLHRVFPSRYRQDPDSVDEDQLSSPSSWETSFKKDFIDFSERHGVRSLAQSPAVSRSPSQQEMCSSPSTMSHESANNSLQIVVPQHPYTIRRETVQVEENAGDQVLLPGSVISSADVTLTLINALGHGAFSSVWLARDTSGVAGMMGLQRSRSKRRPSESIAKRTTDKLVGGLKPAASADTPLQPKGRVGSVVLDEKVGEGASSADDKAVVNNGGNLVAVKMLNRAFCDEHDRTRFSFVREVEVLRHISHPSIVSYLHSFTTNSHHCLVLEHIAGGELFEMINSDEQYARLTEPLLRRMWGELCKAVGWMHGVNLVHRDIKLENVLLTTPISELHGAPPPSVPLIKLTDFGLSRFIDPESPHLTTRCGSESYAAPELILGGGSTDAHGNSVSGYDGRQTDSWACGVVLYALATRELPFDPPRDDDTPGVSTTFHSTDPSPRPRPSARRRGNSRRDLLMRIAHCEYSWPMDKDGNEPPFATPGLKRIVERLIVRKPAKRSRMVDLWDEEWLRGEGAPAPPSAALKAMGATWNGSELNVAALKGQRSLENWQIRRGNLRVPARAPTALSIRVPPYDFEGTSDDEFEEDGVLVDQDDISQVARSEVDVGMS